LSILITLCLVVFYGLPVDPNSGELLADGNYHPGPFHYGGRSRPPAGYKMDIPYPYANQTSGIASDIVVVCIRSSLLSIYGIV
jgi:hypothetical protein